PGVRAMKCSHPHSYGRSPSPLRCLFFSSRRRHTRLVSDWSSDVCSSDLRSRQKVQGRPTPEQIAELKRVKAELQTLEEELATAEIGRASCRERVKTPVAAGAVRKKAG